MNKIIVIGASSGGLKPLRRIIAALPIPCTASVFIVMHLGNHPSILPSVLAASTRLNVSFAKDGSPRQPGRIYVAPPDHHMLLELGLRASCLGLAHLSASADAAPFAHAAPLPEQAELHVEPGACAWPYQCDGG